MPAIAEPKVGAIEGLRSLYCDLHQLGLNLREAAMRFQEMVRGGNFVENGRTFSYSPDEPRDILNRSIDITREFEFLVAVTGAFSSGKSSLLNLLLGQRDLLPASVIPMTAVCTAIRHGDRPRVDVRYVPFEECFARVSACTGQPLQQPFTGPEHLTEALEHPENFVSDPSAAASLRRFAELLGRHDEIRQLPVWFEVRAPYISGGGTLRASDGAYRYFSPTPKEEQQYLEQGGEPRRWVTREWLALIRDVTLWVPSPLLENDIVLLDLPGLNCREDYHRRAIREYCNMADCILVAAFQPGNQADAEVIASFKKLSSNYQEKIFFVFNKVDQFAQEPEELARAVDYLARDTIGADFPRDRFFLTSAQLARARASDDPAWRQDLERLRNSLSPVVGTLDGLDEWVAQVTAAEDPGGLDHLRSSLCSFLVNDAYRTKVAEIVRNYDAVLGSLRAAASPAFEESQHMNATDILRKSVLDYFRYTEKLQRNALQRFRSDYLRGHERNGTPSLRQELNGILEHVHREAHDIIRAYFDRPILASPILEDPVGEFDLLTIADEASVNLRRGLQDMIISSVHVRVSRVFRDFLEQSGCRQHLEKLLRGAPEWLRRIEPILNRFEETMLHSHKCIVRARFFDMPRGRLLKRLERTVPAAQMKEFLVDVFTDFYPSWIYENVYPDLTDRLWLALFLDCEDLDEQLGEFFRSCEGVVTGVEVAEQVQVPAQLTSGTRSLYQSIRMCQDIAELLHSGESLRERTASLGMMS